MALTRRRAIAFGRETTEGVALSTGSLTAYEMALEPVINFDTSKKRRKLATRVLAEQAALEGLKSATVNLSVEMAGHASGLVRPVWADLVEACGFRTYLGAACYAIPIGDITGGPFQDSEAITATGKGGTVMGTYRTGVPYILVENYTGAAPSGSELWTGGTSGATATTTGAGIVCTAALKTYSERTYQIPGPAPTPGTISAGSVVTGGTSGAKALVLADKSGASSLQCAPIDGTGAFQSGEVISDGTNSFTSSGAQSNLYLPSLTMAKWDGERLKVAKGCRGTFSINAPTGEDARMAFSFSGARESVTDAILPSAIASVVANPPVLLGGQTWIDDVADLGLGAFTLDIGSAVGLRPSPSEPSGYISARIGSRPMGGTVNPEAIAEAALDIYEKTRDGETFQLGLTWGTASSNRVFLNMPFVQADNVNDEDNEGRVHDAISFLATGNSPILDNELVIAIF